MLNLKAMLPACFAVLIAASTAEAKAPAFAGTWAANPAQCKNPQDVMDAPMLLTATGYDQHEAHCTFSKLKRKGQTWTAKQSCTVEGDAQTGSVKLKLKGNTLNFMIDGRPWILTRCP